MTSIIPQHIAVTAPPKLDKATQEMETICAYLKQKGSKAACGLLNDENLRKRVHAGEFDLLIAIGGDGTMLRSGHLCAPHDIPVMGINKGHLGFLFQTDKAAGRK